MAQQVYCTLGDASYIAADIDDTTGVVRLLIKSTLPQDWYVEFTLPSGTVRGIRVRPGEERSLIIPAVRSKLQLGERELDVVSIKTSYPAIPEHRTRLA